VSLDAPTAPASSLVGSSSSGGPGFDATPLPSSSGFDVVPFKDAFALSWVREFALLSPCCSFLNPFNRRARELREGPSVKWNDVLLADSIEASKKTVGFINKDMVAEPPVKNYSVSAKKGFLRKGFLNPHSTVIAPPALPLEVKDVRG
jgi:hypothetical protein